MKAAARDRPEAKQAGKRSILIHTPWNVECAWKADARWKSKKGLALFDGSYLSALLQSIWAKQELGLICCSQLANHINTSVNHQTYDLKGATVGSLTRGIVMSQKS